MTIMTYCERFLYCTMCECSFVCCSCSGPGSAAMLQLVPPEVGGVHEDYPCSCYQSPPVRVHEVWLPVQCPERLLSTCPSAAACQSECHVIPKTNLTPISCHTTQSTVMTPWCQQQIPVEENFGRLFDQLNDSIQQLSSEFSAEVAVQVRHSYMPVLLYFLSYSEVTLPLPSLHRRRCSNRRWCRRRISVGRLRRRWISWRSYWRSYSSCCSCSSPAPSSPFSLSQLIPTLLLPHPLPAPSLTGSSFFRAFSYLRCYLNDLHFDNVYITPIFHQIDARRKGAVNVALPGTWMVDQTQSTCLKLVLKWSQHCTLNFFILKFCPKLVKE